MSEKKIIHIYGDQHGFYSDFDGERVIDVIDIFQKELNNIPAEYRNSAKFDVDIGAEYSAYSIVYSREETDEELYNRTHRDEALAKKRKADELAMLDMLIARYGIPNGK